jgi:hypothetical protein
MKILYTLMLFALLLAVPTAAHAQVSEDDYDYAAFRFPDIDRRALVLNFNLQGSGSTRATSFATPRQTFRGHQFAENLDLEYSRFRNLPRLQALESYFFSNSLFVRTEKQATSNIDLNTFSHGMAVRTFSQYRYYHQAERYLGLELQGQVRHEFFRRDNNIIGDRFRRNEVLAELRPQFQYGWGRVEPIDDVFLAKFMVEDMLENGVLSESLSQEQLFALGQRMAFVRNQRIFDARRLRIYELTEIDRWFKEEGLASAGDILYLTTLTDNWLYAFHNTRFAGSRFELGVRPGLFYRYRISRDSESDSRELSLNGSARYERHRPLNQYWQAVSTAEAGLERFWLRGDQAREDWRPYLLLSQQYGYYPNSRTRLNASVGLRYFYSLDFPEPTRDDRHAVVANLLFGADYFVNYQFVIRGNINANYFWDRSQTALLPPFDVLMENQFNYWASLQFLYTIF